MSAAELLTAARAIIEDPANWKQGYSKRVPTCALGAVDLATRGDLGTYSVRIPAQRALYAVTDGMGIGEYNDTHTHAEVLAAFDRAIEIASAV